MYGDNFCIVKILMTVVHFGILRENVSLASPKVTEHLNHNSCVSTGLEFLVYPNQIRYINTNVEIEI